MRSNRKRKDRFLALWLALVVSGLAVAGIGCYLKYAVCKPMGIFQDENVITLPFVLLSDQGRTKFVNELEASRHPTTPPTSPPTQPPTLPPTEPPTKDATTVPPTETDPPTDPPPRFREPEYRVDESYFDDVLFVGDSRTCGLRDYCRLGDADYFCNVGMNVFSTWGETASDLDFGSETLSERLSEKEYGKIYIALGINECGYPLDMLTEAFQTLIGRIQEAQPDAVIVLNSVMTVGRNKADSADYFAIENLAKVNEAIEGLADGERIFFLDVNEVFADEEGYLPEEMSSDGCHLYGEYYETWAKWLCDSVAQLNEA